MIIHKMEQGTQEWFDIRRAYNGPYKEQFNQACLNRRAEIKKENQK